MKKRLIIALAALVAFGSLGFADTISLKLGYYMPGLSSDFWSTEMANMNFRKSDFYGASFAFSYELFLNRYLSLVFGLDTYTRTRTAYYRDYVGLQFTDGDFAFPAKYYNGDFTPAHTVSVTATPIQVSVKIAPLGRRAKVIPYFGGGVAFYLWSLRMSGDMIDFSDPWTYTDGNYVDTVYPIYTVDVVDRNYGRITLGAQAFAGVEIPIGPRWTLQLEGKYSYARGKLGTDPNSGFTGFAPLDLGGLNLSAGFTYWF